MPGKPPRSYRLSEQCKEAIAVLADELKIGGAAVIELAVKKMWQEGISGLLAGHGQEPGKERKGK